MIYFDNASTTRTSENAAKAALKMMRELYSNPSSLHSFGFDCEKVLTEAKNTVLKALNSDGSLIFTSGGTEANNTVILGAAEAYKRKGRHFITTKIEHPSVTAAYKELERQGAEVTYLSLDDGGHISLEELRKAVREDTVLVSLMAVNNEIGTVNDIRKIYETIKSKNPDTLYHADCVQAFCKHEINGKNADFITVSSHKIFGPKGCGALVFKKGMRFAPRILGGEQQNALRPGTENTPGIAAFAAAAADLYDKIPENAERAKAVKAELLKITEILPDIAVNGENTSPYILNLSFKGIRGEVLLHALEDKGIYVSTGSACSSKAKKNENTVAKIWGVPRGGAAVRFSFSSENTVEEAAEAVKALSELVPLLRKFKRR
ncbi:MAG: cysteine desulfurase [Clostridiales bacterium]|nr:cysteine desulfurase [Clostridiales bacterium]